MTNSPHPLGAVKHIGSFCVVTRRLPERSIDPGASVLQRITQRLAAPQPLYRTEYYEWIFRSPPLGEHDRTRWTRV